MNDLRFALRLLWKSPGFTAVALLSIAFGIGATTTVFCWIQEVLLRPLPGIARPEQMVVLCASHLGRTWDTVSRPDLLDYSRLTNVFAGVIGSQVTPACIAVNGEQQWAYGQIATANFFEVLGVKPLLGRTFVAEEDLRPGGAPVLVLGETYWRRRFGGDPGVVGRTVEVNRRPFTIVGVVPQAFRGTMSALVCDFWAPLAMHAQVANFGSWDQRGDHWLHCQARLQPGVSRARAQVAGDLLTRQLEQAYPASNREVGLRVLPVWKAPYGGQAMLLPVLSLLLAVSVGVLLIVAANVANLLLARATVRQKEIAIRLALGVGRARLIRQLLTESVVLAGLGGVLGVLLAGWAKGLFVYFLPKTYLPIGYSFGMNAGTLAFTLLVAVATGLVFGLAPALHASRLDLSGTLKEGGRTSGGGRSHHGLRNALVVVEVALALVLLIGAGLCIQGFRRAQAADIGFNPGPVLLAGMRVGMHGYTEKTAVPFYRQLRERLASLPGVKSAALASWFPLGFEGGSSTGFEVPGYERKPTEEMGAQYVIVSPGYFETLQIRLVEGRDFTDLDDGTRDRVVIINENMARRYWPGQSPVGRKLLAFGGGRELTVVGVAAAGKYRSLGETPAMFIYLPYQQGVWDLNLGVALRAVGEPLGMAGSLRQTIKALDPGVEIWALLPMTDFIQAAFLAQRIVSSLLLVLGAVAVVLAAMGIYGVMSYLVSQRTHELGIRMALGASAGRVTRLVLSQGLRLTGLGLAFGVVGAVALSHFLTSFLYGVSPFDPTTFGTVSALLCVVSLAACFIPAWRAAGVDPMVVLRSE